MNPNLTTTFNAARRARLNGVLLGTAVGDSLGLPAEGMSSKVVQRRWKGVWRHRLIFGRGMCSDDTEHTLMVARSLLGNPDDAAAFQRAFAWRLRAWLLAFPAGVGFATARAILKLWVGFPADRAGVFSAGNGPAMRCAVIGCFFADDKVKRDAFVHASTCLTHTDPKALFAAKAVAEIVGAVCSQPNGHAPGELTADDVLEILRAIDHGADWARVVDELGQAFGDDISVAEFAARLGLQRGVTGYALHTVPVAIYAWWRHRGDFRATLEAVFNCGGDTDTVGAIAGALAGADVGESGIPHDWIEGVWEWPQSVGYLRRLGDVLAGVSCDSRSGLRSPAPEYFWPAILFRNFFFLLVVLFHGFARLIPR